MKRCVLFLVSLAALLPGRSGALEPHVPSGIDHANIAVGNLDGARILFEKLGFTIKPGRPHKNSIANFHLKFIDGTELELITAREPRDSLAAEYIRYAAEGDGGAFVALRVASVDHLAEHLDAVGLPGKHSRSTGMRALVFPEGHRLRPLWFLEFLRPYRDRPEYTTHRNGTLRLRAVWLAASLERELEHLFGTFGIASRSRDWPLPGSRLLDLGASAIYVTPRPKAPPRPFVGATFDVERLDGAAAVLRAQALPFTRHEDARGSSLRVALPALSGFVIEFLQPHEAPPRDPSPREVAPRGKAPE